MTGGPPRTQGRDPARPHAPAGSEGSRGTLAHDPLSVLSHEVRTPLTAIVGLAETLAHLGPDLEPEVVQHLSTRIAASARRLRKLILDIEDLSRIREATMEVTTTATELAPIADQVALEARTADTDISIDVGEGLVVLADPDRLHQVLANLVGNAVRFSPPRSSVAVAAAASGDRIEVRVRDEGPGIPGADLERIFEPFVTEARGGSGGGSGIGLFLCRELTRAMRGEIWAESEVGRGSTFRLRLPAAQS